MNLVSSTTPSSIFTKKIIKILFQEIRTLRFRKVGHGTCHINVTVYPPTYTLTLSSFPLQNNSQMLFLYPVDVLPIFRLLSISASTSNEPVIKVLPKKLQCSLFSKSGEYNFLHLLHLESRDHLTEPKNKESLRN